MIEFYWPNIDLDVRDRLHLLFFYFYKICSHVNLHVKVYLETVWEWETNNQTTTGNGEIQKVIFSRHGVTIKLCQ